MAFTRKSLKEIVEKKGIVGVTGEVVVAAAKGVERVLPAHRGMVHDVREEALGHALENQHEIEKNRETINELVEVINELMEGELVKSVGETKPEELEKIVANGINNYKEAEKAERKEKIAAFKAKMFGKKEATE